MQKRCWFVGIFAAAMMLFGEMLYATSASAGVCDTSVPTQSRFDGLGYSGSVAYEGASATIVTRIHYQCSGDATATNRTSAWAMIADNSPDQNLAQAGLIRLGQWSETHQFWETNYVDGSGNHQTFNYNPTGSTPGDMHDYEIHYVVACSCFHLDIDGTQKLATTWSPYQKWGSQPWAPQWFGETKYADSEIPGTSSVKENFTLLKVQRMANHGIDDVTCSFTMATINSLSSVWGHSTWSSSCPNYSIWQINGGGT